MTTQFYKTLKISKLQTWHKNENDQSHEKTAIFGYFSIKKS